MSNGTAAESLRIRVGYVATGIGSRRSSPARHAVTDAGRLLCGAWFDPVRLVVRDARPATVSCKACLRRMPR